MPESFAFDSPEYLAFVEGFAARLRKGALCLVFSGPTARQRGAVLAELSDAARLPLHVVPLETRLADRTAVMLASLREDFDAAGGGPTILCFRHADRFIAQAREVPGAAGLPPVSYIFERARRFRGAVVLSLDDASQEALVGGRGDVRITFSGDAV